MITTRMIEERHGFPGARQAEAGECEGALPPHVE